MSIFQSAIVLLPGILLGAAALYFSIKLDPLREGNDKICIDPVQRGRFTCPLPGTEEPGVFYDRSSISGKNSPAAVLAVITHHVS